MATALQRWTEEGKKSLQERDAKAGLDSQESRTLKRSILEYRILVFLSRRQDALPLLLLDTRRAVSFEVRDGG